uniref:Myosin light chain 9 n=1 Tax=Leptobrachium leishanense TaxID=445787 RepID=A0A8C5RAW2_9ANUR
MSAACTFLIASVFLYRSPNKRHHVEQEDQSKDHQEASPESHLQCVRHDMLASMGKNPSDEYLEAMMSEAPGPINFTMFLTMFGEKLNGTDPEDVIRNAFACFDEEGTGFINEDHLRELLTTMGDRFTDEEVDEMYREAPIDKKGNFNYVEFTRILKHGAKDKDD